MNNENTYGYVYILVSDKTPYIKIGGTDYLPEKRCKEINTQPFIIDFRNRPIRL